MNDTYETMGCLVLAACGFVAIAVCVMIAKDYGIATGLFSFLMMLAFLMLWVAYEVWEQSREDD